MVPQSKNKPFVFYILLELVSVPENFQTKFRKNPPHRNCIARWSRKFVTTGCLCAKKRSGRPHTTQCGVLSCADRVDHQTSFNFFLVGFIKDRVYYPPIPQNLWGLRQRITEAVQSISQGTLQNVNEWSWNIACIISQSLTALILNIYSAH